MNSSALSFVSDNDLRYAEVMSSPKQDKAREYRIDMEAVVDAYDETERAMGWYCYLEDRIKPPFNARCVTRHAISPLKIGQAVKVLGMAPAEECESDMFVMIEYDGDELGVPLAQLAPVACDAATKEAIADWHYWVARGYEF